MSRWLERHASLFAQAEHWFDRGRAALLNELPCRRGCHRCCIGMFAVTMLDVIELQRGLAQLEPAVREEIQEQGRTQATALEEAFPRLAQSPYLTGWSDADLDSVARQFADIPCPALSDGDECRVYESRPITCRMMGLPIEADDVDHGACDVQTFVPIKRLPRVLREEENQLANKEAGLIYELSRIGSKEGEETWLAYGFLPDRLPILDSLSSAVVS
jgi:Fe-S-cluster containining protein